MSKIPNITADELMGIISGSLRQLSDMDLNDKNINKCIAKSKEISNLTGKAIALSYYELERAKLGMQENSLLNPIKNVNKIE